MPTLVEHGHDVSGATTEVDSNVEIGQRYFDTTLGQSQVYDGTSFVPANGLFAKEVTFTETSGAGVYTGSVTIPAGATIVDVLVHATALWDNAGACTMKVGDATDDDGIFTGIDLKATDLTAAQSINFDRTGGKEGAYLVGTATHWTTRYLATARVISGIVTTASTGGSAGRTRMVVVYALGTPVAATKV
jgi:hypothetical protein